MTDEISVIEQLDFKAGTVSIHDKPPTPLSALKHHYVEQAKRFDDKDGNEGIDAVYFSGEYPSVYFKSVKAFTPETVNEVVRIQRKVWNQGKVPFLYVESPTEVRVYNCYSTPQNEIQDDAEDSLLLISATKQAKSDLEDLRKVFDKVAIESGGFWQEKKYADRVDVKKRVDRALITNIKKTRIKLRLQGLKDDVIHDLLLRSLFILYLEDRKATDQVFYDKYLPGADSYFIILTDSSATYRLFDTLETTFNGNLCPVQPGEREAVKVEHLDTIKRCFWSDFALLGQPTLFDWRIFDFGFIPIQVISEIYEDFLSKEVGEDQMAKTGAFYTPHALAEFILNQVLPYPSPGDTKHNTRTLDPTCGSGIFLVDSLNRLLDRWQYAHPDKSLTFEIIKRIVLDNIFGIEIEPEAIKVAAFSIYLAMLDRLDPKTLWQNKQFPYLIYDPSKPNQKQGQNLFRMSSLISGPFEKINFDLVVGNPPFGTKNLEPDVRDYLKRLAKLNRNHDFAKETVIAFLHRVTNLCPTGTIALLSTSKVLFNNKSTSQNFRQFLFNETYVKKVYNFSALRRVSEKLDGRNLFDSVVRPVCVLLYSKQIPIGAAEHIIYYTPTTAIKNRLIDGIAIDPIDVKYLPRVECQKPDSKIWKVSMWGTERDFDLIKSFLSRGLIGLSIRPKKVKNIGVGFELNPQKKPAPTIKELPYLPANAIERFYTPERKTKRISYSHFRTVGALEAYIGPHVLIKEGQVKKRFCATYTEYSCSFMKTIFGISMPDQPEHLKLLTAFLNSKLASYIMFLTSGDWGVERERVMPNEVLDIPDLCFTLSTKVQKQIVDCFEEIVNLKRQNAVSSTDHRVAEIEHTIEQLLWDGLNLSKNDRILIDDLLDYRLDAFQEKEKSDAFLPCLVSNSRAYATHLCDTINHFLQPDDSIQAHAQYFELSNRTPLQVIILHLDEQKQANKVEKLPTNDIQQILRDLEVHTYREEAESIYFRRFIRYYNNDTIYIVKPNERRFWSRSMALNDADDIILEILTSEA